MFTQAGIPLWIRPYKIISTGNSTGLIAVSADMMIVLMMIAAPPHAVLPDSGVWLMVRACDAVCGQFVTDAISIDALKKSTDFPGSLRAHFLKTYGAAHTAVRSPQNPTARAAGDCRSSVLMRIWLRVVFLCG
jgi:hypothetical protein